MSGWKSPWRFHLCIDEGKVVVTLLQLSGNVWYLFVIMVFEVHSQLLSAYCHSDYEQIIQQNYRKILGPMSGISQQKSCRTVIVVKTQRFTCMSSLRLALHYSCCIALLCMYLHKNQFTGNIDVLACIFTLFLLHLYNGRSLPPFHRLFKVPIFYIQFITPIETIWHLCLSVVCIFRLISCRKERWFISAPCYRCFDKIELKFNNAVMSNLGIYWYGRTVIIKLFFTYWERCWKWMSNQSHNFHCIKILFTLCFYWAILLVLLRGWMWMSPICFASIKGLGCEWAHK